MRKKQSEQLRRIQEEAALLAQEVNYLQEEMAATMEHFSAEVDPELVDYYTYYYKAAEIKHGYLLRKLKKIYYGDKKSHVI